MKLFHTSDWHLGRMLYGRSLLEDQRWFLRQVFLPAVERERPCCVLIAGDVYDRQIAPVEAIALFDETLSQLLKLGTKVCVIAGNHDGPGRMALLKNALRHSGVYFATQLSDAFSPVLLEEKGQALQIFPLPYFDAAQGREFLGDESLRGEGACMELLLERLVPLFQPGAGHLLVSHCFAAGAQTSDSESATFVGGSGQVPPALFAQLEWDGREMARQFVPCAPLRDVRRVKGTFAHLLEAGEQSPVEDYVEIELTDSAPVLLAAERLRPFYPNLLSVLNPWMGESLTGERAARLKGQDEATVFAAFLREVCGTEPDPQDQALFQEVLESLAESQET